MTDRIAKPELIADIREQILYLQELGVDELSADLLRVEARVGAPVIVPQKPAAVRPPVEDAAPIAFAKMPEFKVEPKKLPEQRPAGGSRLSSLPSLSKRPMAAAGKNFLTADRAETPETPETRETAETPETPETTGAPETTLNAETPKHVNTEIIPDESQPTSAETIPQIRAEIGPDCTRCKLSTLGRSRVVNSVGNFVAELMFVGEAPGADEDEQGEPFVGRAGQLLTKIIESIGISRDDVFIGNINRCRPPGNRAPESDETVACKPFLMREIAVIRPKVIVVLGATAAHNLLETKVPIGKLRGHFHDYHGSKVMPTFHPAYLLRDPHKKREVWEDMKMVRAYLTSLK